MKVLELLDEIEEIVDTASGFPLTGKIMVDSAEILEIVKEIRSALPEEIEQAKWIKNERERILNEAKSEYETVVTDARNQASALVESDDITVKAKKRADEITRVTEQNVKQMKLNTYDYVDSILFNFQNKMEQLQATYFADMFNNLEQTFGSINQTLEANREEIKNLAYRTQMDADE